MDWRLSLTPQSRQDVIKKLIEVVKLAAPSQDQAKLAELASSTEQAIFEKSKSKQEYILLLQQKIANLQAKIAVIQKNQSAFGSPALASNYMNNQSPVPVQGVNPILAPKYQMGTAEQIGQVPQISRDVPTNLKNMVINLQQQQAKNMKNSLKNQHEARQAFQAAKIAQQTLMGVQMHSSSHGSPASQSASPMQTSLQTSLQAPFQSHMPASLKNPVQATMPGKSPMLQPGSTSALQTNSPSPSNSMPFPLLNLSDAQRADVTEKLKKIMPIYQKVDLIIKYLSSSEVSSKTNIQKLLQLKNLLTEQYKNLKRCIFLSPEGLGNIYDFLVKMLQAAEEIRASKVSTPSQSISTLPNIPKSETITDAFKYAMEQELYYKKSSKTYSATPPSPLITGNFNWTSELTMYGIDAEPVVPERSCLDSVFEDYEYLFGSFDSIKQGNPRRKSDESSLDSIISHLESVGFIITKLSELKDLQVFLIKNTLQDWSEWQLLHYPPIQKDKPPTRLDRNLLEGKSMEMIQFLQLS